MALFLKQEKGRENITQNFRVLQITSSDRKTWNINMKRDFILPTQTLPARPLDGIFKSLKPTL
jgi:hypothetical protein